MRRKTLEICLIIPIWGPKHGVWCEINTSFTFGYVSNWLSVNCISCFSRNLLIEHLNRIEILKFLALPARSCASKAKPR